MEKTLTLTQAEQIVKHKNCYKSPPTNSKKYQSIIYKCNVCPSNNYNSNDCIDKLIAFAHKIIILSKWIKL